MVLGFHPSLWILGRWASNLNLTWPNSFPAWSLVSRPLSLSLSPPSLPSLPPSQDFDWKNIIFKNNSNKQHFHTLRSPVSYVAQSPVLWLSHTHTYILSLSLSHTRSLVYWMKKIVFKRNCGMHHLDTVGGPGSYVAECVIMALIWSEFGLNCINSNFG